MRSFMVRMAWELHRDLKSASVLSGVSMGEIIRRSVHDYLESHPTRVEQRAVADAAGEAPRCDHPAGRHVAGTCMACGDPVASVHA